jgi:phosphopantothenoylcysteine decarboxylase/phosphopantothenate--cysteine ligase
VKGRREIILGVTGGIAAYKACDIINGLRKVGIGVTVIMTKEAGHFITPLTLQSLSGNKVYSDMFETVSEWEPEHIALAKKADLVLVAPCSANVIGKVAAGICDDLLTCTILATKAKVLFAPAMNENMYKHKTVQANIAKLKDCNYKIIGPIKGRLVCGDEGIGHLAGVDDILKEAKRLLK